MDEDVLYSIGTTVVKTTLPYVIPATVITDLLLKIGIPKAAVAIVLLLL